jgi:hypothetical protein
VAQGLQGQAREPLEDAAVGGPILYPFMTGGL